MKAHPFARVGSALVWQAVRLGGVKGIFALRLLVLAWLLTPEDFGLMAIAVSAVGFLLQITDLGMIPALVQRADVDEQHYNAAWTIGLTRALSISALVILAAPLISALFNEPRAVPIIQVLALRPVLDALTSIKVADLARNIEFRPLTFLKLSDALANTLVAVIMAPTFGVWALVGGTLVGSTTYFLISYLVAPHRPRLSFRQQAIRPLVRFGRWIFITGLINTAGIYVLRVVISRQLGTTELGLFFLASQLAFLPSEIASEVIGSVAFPLFARLQSDLEQLARAFRTVVSSIATFLFPVCALLLALAPSLVHEVLGPRWAGTIPVIQVLALACLVSLPGEAIVPLLNGFGQPYKVTILETVQSLLLIVFAGFLTSRFGLPGAALTWIPALVGSLLLALFFIRQILVKPLARLIPFLAAITFISGLGALVAAGIDSYLPGLAGLILATILAIIAIFMLLWLSDRRLSLGLREDLGQLFPRLAPFIGRRANNPAEQH